MTLEFPYLSERIVGLVPPSLEPGSLSRWRPLIPLRIHCQGKAHRIPRALVDTGADDTVLPLAFAHSLGIELAAATPFQVRWRGQVHPLHFGVVSLRLEADERWVEWPATVSFTPATIRYPILGVAGCLEFFNVTFLGGEHLIRLEPNFTFPGSMS